MWMILRNGGLLCSVKKRNLRMDKLVRPDFKSEFTASRFPIVKLTPYGSYFQRDALR